LDGSVNNFSNEALLFKPSQPALRESMPCLLANETSLLDFRERKTVKNPEQTHLTANAPAFRRLYTVVLCGKLWHWGSNAVAQGMNRV
jgi:hypothetical protein